MPELSVERLVFFLFVVLPGFIAIQAYGLKCPTPKRDWGSSLTEAITYSLINLSIWMWWVLRIVRLPFGDVDVLELTAAIVCVCFLSPIILALGWYWLRTSFLHRKLKMDHPTPRGWDHFVRINHEFWVLFHWKSGKMSGGYFGEHSYASTFPHDPEIYVEEMWRVNERGEFTEIIERTLGGVVRISECERVEFFKVSTEGGLREADQQRSAGPSATCNRRETGQNECGSAGPTVPAEQPTAASTGRLIDGTTVQSVEMN